MISRIINSAPFLAMAAALVRVVVLVVAGAVEDLLATRYGHAALQFVIAGGLLALANASWRYGWKEARNAE